MLHLSLAAESELPRQLGRYTILRELGRGAMGRVFLAHDPEIDRRVAIKTVQAFNASASEDPLTSRERFLREARAFGRLAHPGIVTLYDVDDEGGLLFLVMEYVEGETLEGLCTPERLLPPAVAAALVAEAARALDHAHRAGIVHRDIKPANLIRVAPTLVKVTDFGLAKRPDTQLTQDGSLLGTPSYMSPEQIRGSAIDGRSDLFSLAVVLFELLTGTKPFAGDSISSVLYRIVHEPALEPSRPLTGVSPALAAFLERALAKDPAGRFATGGEFAAALGGAADSASSGAPQAISAPPPAPGSARSRSRPIAVRNAVIAMLAVTLAAIGAVQLRSRPPARPEASSVPVFWETAVRTEPAGLDVLLDGVPLPPADGGRVRFRAGGPFGVLSARQECRTATHRLGPADAGGEIVLVVDPTTLSWPVQPAAEHAALALNGERVAMAPAMLALDLCRENRIELAAPGHRPSRVELPAGASLLEARRALAGLEPAPLPRGTLALPEAEVDLVYYIDGERIDRGQHRVELTEGEHRLEMKNDAHWIDVAETVHVRAGETAQAGLVPTLTVLTVQAFPPNCRVWLRPVGGVFRFLDETPVQRRVAAGSYDLKVQLVPTEEVRVVRVDLAPGPNPPVRIAFARGARP